MNAFLAPLVFTRVQEYPLAMIAAALVRPPLERRSNGPSYRPDLIWAGILFLVILGVVLWASKVLSPRLAHVLIFGIAGVFGLSMARRPVRFGLGIAAIMLATSWYRGSFGEVLFSERSFFGVYRAFHDTERNLIFHGTTLHGAQNLRPAKRLQPTSYFHPTGPVGDAFRRWPQGMSDKPVAVIGLGAGALACYGKAGQEFVFYEVDPLVERIARDARIFTYLRDCPPRSAVKIGDARVMLVNAPDRHYGILILDAFSGDSIPIHLLTKEAVQLYVSKIRPEGALLFHISNRYMNLIPVVDRLSAELGMTAFLRDDFDMGELENREGKQPSRWVVMAPERRILALFNNDSKWIQLTGRMKSELWTDNYSNVLQTIHW